MFAQNSHAKNTPVFPSLSDLQQQFVSDSSLGHLYQFPQDKIRAALSASQLQQLRINHLYQWLLAQLQSSHNDYLQLSATDLPLTFNRYSKLADQLRSLSRINLPNRERLPQLHYALFEQGRLIEGFGLRPDQVQPLRTQLDINAKVLILSRQQCTQLAQQLAAFAIR
ncbi:hypothetical protein BTE48_10550 [Oceanospirillum multiglobuliferum]|uniref:Uncharacterized protein n=2 Tax=Oceanospirillum multiglobuliferum TaxID=64969 RepID=A0A1V4T4S7_9GAMM|nr:hypothetical protein BTE48_10550 [Oceanospirillum multiglobuliferum]